MKVGFRPRIAACLLALALPSARFSWSNRDVPCFSKIHDDSIYFVCAKSLAAGTGYRITSLPGAPYQTKYPPLYPLFLSLAWRLDPSFPSNLSVALALNWLCVPFLLCLGFLLLRDLGFPEVESLGVTAFLALSPSLLLLGAYLLSELAFTVLLLTALLLLNRAQTPAMALAAGFAASLATLTRSAGLPLLASGVVFLWQQRNRRSAFFFAAAMAPAALAWQWWCHSHRLATRDPFQMYYTDYLGYYLYNVDLRSLPVFFWRDADEFFSSLGSYLLAPVTGGVLARVACDVVAAAGIHGLVRLWRRTPAVRPYALFGLLYSAPLLFWHYPSNQRLLFPLAPLFLAGLYTELAAVFSMLRSGWQRPDRGQRAAAAAIAGMVASLLLAGGILQGITLVVVLPRTFALCRRDMLAERAAFRWVKENLAPNARILAHDDAFLYLATGRKAMRVTLPPKPYYFEDRASLLAIESEVAPYARQRGFNYVSGFPFDAALGADGGLGHELQTRLRQDPALSPVYQAGSTSLYRVR
jgi:hypothetical protein